MKPNTHPPTHPVIFLDTSSGAEFITTSTLSSDTTRDIDGVTYFVINVEISSASHPFFTGEERFVDTAGRVDKFKEKLARTEDVAKGRVGKKAKREAKIAEKKALEVKKPKKEKKPAPAVEAPTADAPTEIATEAPADTEK
jgi:large subunit ribosomal protein L31